MRRFPDLANTTKWRLAGSRALSAQRIGRDWRCPDQTFNLTKYVCAIGVSNPQAQPTWRLAAWAEMNVAIGVNSGSYPASVATGRRRCWLNQMNLLILPKLDTPWQLKLQFPRWHLLINLEVWEYTGEDIDELMRLDQIEAEILQQ